MCDEIFCVLKRVSVARETVVSNCVVRDSVMRDIVMINRSPSKHRFFFIFTQGLLVIALIQVVLSFFAKPIPFGK